jgi:hypothetical protein
VEGLEPPASGFGDRRSSQLSYTPTAGQRLNQGCTIHGTGRDEGRRKDARAALSSDYGEAAFVPPESRPGRAWTGRWWAPVPHRFRPVPGLPRALARLLRALACRALVRALAQALAHMPWRGSETPGHTPLPCSGPCPWPTPWPMPRPTRPCPGPCAHAPTHARPCPGHVPALALSPGSRLTSPGSRLTRCSYHVLDIRARS